jgi:ADP-ribose pyrophosphatase YjhB (NUDIX family)
MSGTFRNPLPTVDIIIEVAGGIVLIDRKNPPHGWAIPGGFVDYGESVEACAVREAREETGLIVRLIDLLYVYSRPDRDPRHHTLTTVFIATAEGVPAAADDARAAGVFSARTLPAPLAFDHAAILADYFQCRDGADRKRVIQKYF